MLVVGSDIPFFWGVLQVTPCRHLEAINAAVWCIPNHILVDLKATGVNCNGSCHKGFVSAHL